MTIEKLFPSGDLLISDIVGNQWIKQRYSGYSKQEAKSLFKQEIQAELDRVIVNQSPKSCKLCGFDAGFCQCETFNK